MSQSHLYVTVTRYTITTSRYSTRRLSKHKRRNAVKKTDRMIDNGLVVISQSRPGLGHGGN